MSNQQQTRMLAATEIQLDKKRHLKFISRAAKQSNFNHEQERLIALKSEQNQLQKEQALLARADQNFQASAKLQERLITAQNLRWQKHRHESLMTRAVPEDNANQKFDISKCWWITPSMTATETYQNFNKEMPTMVSTFKTFK